MIRVKICGVTNRKDALAATAMGVSALGFIFSTGPRQISPEKTRRIISELPPFVETVGVFLHEHPRRIRQIMDYSGIGMAQLHGDYSSLHCRSLMPRVIKAFRIKERFSAHDVLPYRNSISAALLDTYKRGVPGGTGEPFNWKLVRDANKLDVPLILAGGLSPSNLLEAVSNVEPYAVDVNSGIEERPGKKDLNLMQDFMEKVETINASPHLIQGRGLG